jgi:hypothetical protein
MIVRIYPPIRHSAYAWAHHWRAVIHLGDGSHIHALPDRNGVLKVTTRDVSRGKINKEEAEALNRLLADIECSHAD